MTVHLPATLLTAVVAVGLASSAAAAAVPMNHLVLGSTGTPAVEVLNVTRDGHISLAPGGAQPAGLVSFGLAVSPDGRAVYTSQTVGGTIIGYGIAADGSLSRLPGAEIATDGTVVGLVVTPNGKTLFAAVGYGPIGEVLSYSISPSGALAPTGAPPVRYGGGADALGQVVVTPDGRILIASSYAGGSLTSFAIGAGSRLTRLDGPVPTEGNSTGPTLTPDGRFVYISNEQANDISGFAIGGDGKLTPTPGSPYPAGNGPHGEAITATGRRLYSPANLDGTIHGFTIAADGRLTPLPGSPWPSPDALRVILSPDGHLVFAIQSFGQPTSNVSSYVVNASGSLTPTGIPPANTGFVYEDGPAAFFTPDQGPVAALRVLGRARGLTRTFSAAASYAPDGSVASYRWDYGDGTNETTTTPTVTHRYRSGGSRTVTVTVTDDNGCSTALISDGMSVECNGGPRARAQMQVQVGGMAALGCPPASGRLAGRALGPAKLAMTRAQLRHRFVRYSLRDRRYMDFFCLHGSGIRAGYASPMLLAQLPRARRRGLAGRAVLLLTANRHYALRGVRPGEPLRDAVRALRVGVPFPLGRNEWYLAPAGAARGVLKVRHGVVEEIGIADQRLTASRQASRRFLRTFY